MTARDLWAALGGHRGHHVFRLGSWEGKQVHLWHPTGHRNRFERMLADHSWNSDLSVSLRPYADHGSFRLHADAGCCWVRCESARQVGALEAFDPQPTFVVREGGTVKHVALWALPRPIDPESGTKVNRHLAHKLRCAKKHAEQLWLVPPGAVIREGRSKPLPVVVAGGSGELVTLRALCRTLPREIPNPDAWRGVAAQ